MSRDQLRLMLMRDEGTGPMKNGRFMPYWDCCGRGLRKACKAGVEHRGNLTIGYGRNIEANGLRQSEAEGNLDHDIDDVIPALAAQYPWMEQLNEPRQGALVNLGFNLGLEGLTHFPHTISLLRGGHFEDASVALLESHPWVEQVGDRALRIGEMIRRGEWV